MKHLIEYTDWLVNAPRRSPRAIKQQYCKQEMQRHLDNIINMSRDNGDVYAEMRNDLDKKLREYHKTMSPHYEVLETFKGESIVIEHMIPVKRIIDLLIKEEITVDQACNLPICKLPKSLDVKLNDNGYKTDTPCPYFFTKRYYNCFDNEIVDDAGNVISVDFTIEQHLANFS